MTSFLTVTWNQKRSIMQKLIGRMKRERERERERRHSREFSTD